LPSSSASDFQEQRDDHGNRHHGNVDDHLARSFAVKPAPSARRYAALGLDRSLQPSKLADHAFDAALSTESTNLNPPSRKSLTQII
jgi:hypothetical protein